MNEQIGPDFQSKFQVRVYLLNLNIDACECTEGGSYQHSNGGTH